MFTIRIIDRVHVSAIYCSSGAQAAKRAAEGFDMVRFAVLHSPCLISVFTQINAASDMGAMSEAIAAQLAIAMK